MSQSHEGFRGSIVELLGSEAAGKAEQKTDVTAEKAPEEQSDVVYEVVGIHFHVVKDCNDECIG